MVREMRRVLSVSFHTRAAKSENAIKDAIDDLEVHGLILDLDAIGEHAEDGVEVLQEMRRLRADMMMVAVTGSASSELPLQATQAGADHFFLKPLDYESMRELLLQTLEKRALQFEGLWLLRQVENRSAFCGLIGGSEAMRKIYQAITAVADSNANVV